MTSKEFITRTLKCSIPSTSLFNVFGTLRQLPGSQNSVTQYLPLWSLGVNGRAESSAPADVASANGRVSYSDNAPPQNN